MSINPPQLDELVEKAGKVFEYSLSIINSFWKVALGLIAIGILAFVFWVLLYGGGILETLKEPAVVRGFITFIIAIATIAIAVILVIAAFLATNGISGSADFKTRFDMAKGVLTTLIGILGTIVGFYFGSAEKAKTPEEARPPAVVQALKVADVRVDKNNPLPGETITLTFRVTGGKAPYHYTVTFPDKTIPPLAEKESKNGNVKEEIPIPSTLPPDTYLTPIKIKVTDKDKQSSDFEMKEPKIQVKAKGS
jgi:hypothetical protein